jgi:branched-chain amino acid transport system ATP-binding protein
MGELLKVSDLHAGYEAVDVLHGISLHVDDGEFVCVIGANTAGKSTLLRAISRLVPRSSGTITFNGNDLMTRTPHEVPALGIAHVPEGRHVFPDMSVVENLWLGGFAARQRADVAGLVDQVLTLFPRLAERRNQLAGTLSGGEQQMLVVGRGLVLQPRLLILDEPSHGLAPMIVEELHQTLQRIHEEGTSVLLVEQNTALALSVASRGYVLQSGDFVLEGTSAELMANDQVRAAYLGI